MRLNHLHHTIRQQTWLQVFTIYTRYLIGSAFIIAAIGMGKLSGDSNLLQSSDKPIQDLQPIQQFFRVMADSGLYWKFIGWAQIAAGVLLLTQRLARLGALMFFGMILNIFIITLSYDFKGTPVVTGLMLLASIYLLLWDLPYFLPLFTARKRIELQRLPLYDHPFWILLGVIMIAVILLAFFMGRNFLFQLGLPFLTGLAGFVFFFWKLRKPYIGATAH